MLQYRTVEPRTLELLKKLMSIPELSTFQLVGGTALALYYGHRLSVDLDLFSTSNFDTDAVLAAIERDFPDFAYSRPNAVGIFGFIGDVKVDFVRYHGHPVLSPVVIEEGIRLCGVHDIMAMKIAAVLKRSVKKDFWDVAELLEHYSLQQMIDCYHQKFPSHQLLISIPQALTYFSEADESEEPVSLKEQTWKSVKNKIQISVNAYLK